MSSSFHERSALASTVLTRPAAAPTLAPDPPSRLVTLREPIRAYDSRNVGGHSRRLVAPNWDSVNLPVGVVVMSAFVNVTITDTAVAGFLVVSEAPLFATPKFSTINWSSAGTTLANLTLMTVDSENLIAVSCFGNGSTHYIIDVMGYLPAPAA